MSVEKTLEVRGEFDEWRLKTRYDTEQYERENWSERKTAGDGIIREKGQAAGRALARIPLEDAAMLRANYDLDWLCFEQNNDKAALRRLLKRFPYWQICEGGV